MHYIWFWMAKPIAEFLTVIAILLSIFICCGLTWAICTTFDWWNKK